MVQWNDRFDRLGSPVHSCFEWCAAPPRKYAKLRNETFLIHILLHLDTSRRRQNEKTQLDTIIKE